MSRELSAQASYDQRAKNLGDPFEIAINVHDSKTMVQSRACDQ